MNRSKITIHEYYPRLNGFQSLFSWMNRSKCKTATLCPVWEKFQSLFSWMNRSKMLDVCHAAPCSLVSILVLLDESLEGHLCQRPAGNPGVSILVLLDESLEEDTGVLSERNWGVSILVLLDESLEGCDGVYRLLSDQFQSLFSWMNRSKNTSLLICPSMRGFNPCSLG